MTDDLSESTRGEMKFELKVEVTAGYSRAGSRSGVRVFDLMTGSATFSIFNAFSTQKTKIFLLPRF